MPWANAEDITGVGDAHNVGPTVVRSVGVLSVELP